MTTRLLIAGMILLGTQLVIAQVPPICLANEMEFTVALTCTSVGGSVTCDPVLTIVPRNFRLAATQNRDDCSLASRGTMPVILSGSMCLVVAVYCNQIVCGPGEVETTIDLTCTLAGVMTTCLPALAITPSVLRLDPTQAPASCNIPLGATLPVITMGATTCLVDAVRCSPIVCGQNDMESTIRLTCSEIVGVDDCAPDLPGTLVPVGFRLAPTQDPATCDISLGGNPPQVDMDTTCLVDAVFCSPIVPPASICGPNEIVETLDLTCTNAACVPTPRFLPRVYRLAAPQNPIACSVAAGGNPPFTLPGATCFVVCIFCLQPVCVPPQTETTIDLTCTRAGGTTTCSPTLSGTPSGFRLQLTQNPDACDISQGGNPPNIVMSNTCFVVAVFCGSIEPTTQRPTTQRPTTRRPTTQRPRTTTRKPPNLCKPYEVASRILLTCKSYGYSQKVTCSPDLPIRPRALKLVDRSYKASCDVSAGLPPYIIRGNTCKVLALICKRKSRPCRYRRSYYRKDRKSSYHKKKRCDYY